MSADDFTILLPGLGDGKGLGITAEQLLERSAGPSSSTGTSCS